MEYSVLIVESDNRTQTDLNEILKNKFNIGQIVTVDSAERALSELENQDSIQCIFINSEIAEVNEYEFISNVKEQQKYRDTAILILSDDNSREALLQAAGSGANELISTPISSKLLSLKLKRVFKNKAFRTAERISVMGAIDVTIQFAEGYYYTSKLIDISSGGCSVQSPLLAQGGGVYDKVQIILEDAGKTIEFPAELVRIEKDPESEAKHVKELLLAFQITNLNENENSNLCDFIDSLGKKNPKN